MQDQSPPINDASELLEPKPDEIAQRDVAEIVRRHSNEIRSALMKWTVMLDTQE